MHYLQNLTSVPLSERLYRYFSNDPTLGWEILRDFFKVLPLIFYDHNVEGTAYLFWFWSTIYGTYGRGVFGEWAKGT